ncbi:hypothetical protein MESS2_1030163 [Mesorhizobium metallidurans STM 2683]|uniref:Uncharacterized protein n=1 Tax=Mesorhizobium metallidurans STM 2683 TaxID=1297569 RepID=M5EUD6_9HYPH|nr:hypothetical protein MESS2_1030163 [Mesorhizobium metallidurans STM 2683]
MHNPGRDVRDIPQTTTAVPKAMFRVV